MLISFIRGEPALLIKKEKILVAGDLHIGLNLRFRASGIHFENATERLADRLVSAYKKSGARRLILLGDVKESITRLRFAEYRELKTFFERIAGIDTEIVKGNHDADLDMVLRNLGFKIPVKREILTDQVALTHGNSWPTEDAMRKRYLIVGHGHFAMRRGENREKVWLVASATKSMKKKYRRYNNAIKLVVVPSFNELVIGSTIKKETRDYLPMLRNNSFSFGDAKLYDLDGKLEGKVAEYLKQD